MTRTEEETERLGSRFARWFLNRDVIPSTRILCLNGDVGSGKSVFSRGFVREIVGQDVLDVLEVSMGQGPGAVHALFL